MSDHRSDDLDEARLVIEPAASADEYAAIVAVMRAHNHHVKEVAVPAELKLSAWRQAARRESLREQIRFAVGRKGWNELT